MRYFLLLLLLMLPVWAAVPPLSSEERTEDADLIVVGLVEKIETRAVELDYGKNTVYELDVLVRKVEKGKMTGQRLLVTCWQPLERPAGWAGPQGQNEIPSQDAVIRLYLRDAGEGAYEILEPNGWEAH